MTPIRLGVNVDHVATVRQARRGSEPDPVELALVCEQAGADSIVAHLREDRRHIQDHDLRPPPEAAEDPPQPRDGPLERHRLGRAPRRARSR